MRPERLFNMPATITHVTQDGDGDEYGDPTPRTSTDNTVCWIHQGSGLGVARSSSEQTGLVNVETEHWTCYLPAGTVLDADDTITVDGDLYQVAGPPWPATHPRSGVVEYMLVQLVRAG